MVALRRDEIGRQREEDAARARVRAPRRLRVVGGEERLRVVGDIPARVREDALPEHTEYRDTGCELSASCLQCPLARCKYDAPGGAPRLATEARDREIRLLRRRYRAPVHMLAQTYGLSRRSIFRVLAAEAAGRVT